MNTAARVAVIIVNYRTPDLVAECLDALGTERQALPRLHAVVVDGGSNDGSAGKIGAHIARAGLETWVRLRPLNVNGGFGWANNQAIREMLGADQPPEYIYLLNPDAVVRPGAVARLVEALEADHAAGAAGSRLLDHDGQVLGSAFRFPTAGSEFARGADTGLVNGLLGIPPLRVDAEARARVDWVTGASVMLRTAAIHASGVFDEGFFLYFEEVELMYRLRRAGWHVLHEPASEVVHVGGASTGLGVAGQTQKPLPGYWHRSRLRYFARTRGRIGAVLVNLSWLAGKAVWALRALAGRAPAHRHPPGELAGMLQAGLWPTTHDLLPHGMALDEVGAAPAWQSRA